MNKIGMIVDGDGDYASIIKKYKNKVKVLKTDGPRGHCAMTEQIVSKSRKQVRMLKDFNCKKIIVIIDYECRSIPYNKFVQRLKDSFKNIYDDLVAVVSPNIMIENWYLADVEKISAEKVYIKKKLQQKKYEGRNGKQCLKTLFVPKYSYSETKHGPELFCLIRDDVASRNSNSCNNFLLAISE